MQAATFALAPGFILHRQDGLEQDAVGLQLLADTAAEAVGNHRRLTLDATHADAVLVGLLLAHQHQLDVALARDTAITALPADGRVALAPGVTGWLDAGDTVHEGARIRLNTSGTTGKFKTASYLPERLSAAVRQRADGAAAVWLLTYEPASFAGVQVLLMAALNGATVLAPSRTVPALAKAAAHGRATHISATPSFWRALLAALPADQSLPLKVATLGGEASPQDLLDAIAARFPGAAIRHIYASTEAGVGFTVADGRAGFPSAWLEAGIDGVRLRVTDGELEIHSARGMLGYEGLAADMAEGGWLRSGDLVAVDGDRVLFQGRRDSVVNIGGTKVLPEKVEACLAGVAGVVDIAVTARPSPILGHILIAEVCAAPGADTVALEAALKACAQGNLPPPARPARYRFVDSVVLASGKKGRKHDS